MSPGGSKRLVLFIFNARLAERLAMFKDQASNALSEFELNFAMPQDAAGTHALISGLDPETCHGVVIGGGDGTVHWALDALMTKGIPLYIWALGTGNDLAHELGMVGPTERMFGAIRRAKVAAMDLVACNGAPMATMAGFGLSAEVVHKLEDLRRKSAWFRLIVPIIGRRIYALVALLVVFATRKKALHWIVQLDGHTRVERSSTLLVVNTRRAGGGLLFAPDAVYDDGVFEVVSLNERGRLGTLVALWQISREKSPTEVMRLSGGDLRLRTHDGQSQIFYTDGELLTPAVEWHFTILPRALKIFMPS